VIAAGMAYAMAVALLFGLAALATERFLTLRRFPRRAVWATALAASLIVPCVVLSSSSQVSQPQISPGNVVSHKIHPGMVNTIRGDSAVAVAHVRIHWPMLPDLDLPLVSLWAVSSVSVLLLLAGTSLQFRRRTRKWRLRRLGNASVLIADGAGPAVLGVITPRIVLPRWLLSAPASARSMVLRHEREHIAARDPLLMTLAILLVALAPWNAPLWWQLRRLRFAIEVDCDARVLRHGADPVAYGETLLSVGQHRSRMPLAAMALTESASQLERRIQLMLVEAPGHSIALVGAFLALAVTLCAGAAELDEPVAPSVTELRKPPPSPAQQLGERFAQIVKARYPQLLNEKLDRNPVVNILFKQDGTVDHADYQVVSGQPEDAIDAAYYAGHFHMEANKVAYMGLRAIVSPSTGQRIVIAFTERKKPNQPYVSKVIHSPDTRAIDRSLTQRYFPDAIKSGAADQERLWVLFDSDGHVVRAGKDSSSGVALTHVLEERFPGIETEFITATAVTDQRWQPMNTLSGKPLQLFCIWLKKGSSLPHSS